LKNNLNSPALQACWQLEINPFLFRLKTKQK